MPSPRFRIRTLMIMIAAVAILTAPGVWVLQIPEPEREPWLALIALLAGLEIPILIAFLLVLRSVAADFGRFRQRAAHSTEPTARFSHPVCSTRPDDQ